MHKNILLNLALVTKRAEFLSRGLKKQSGWSKINEKEKIS